VKLYEIRQKDAIIRLVPMGGSPVIFKKLTDWRRQAGVSAGSKKRIKTGFSPEAHPNIINHHASSSIIINHQKAIEPGGPPTLLGFAISS